MKIRINEISEKDVVIKNGYYKYGFYYFKVMEEEVLMVKLAVPVIAEISIELLSKDMFKYFSNTIEGMESVSKEEFDKFYNQVLNQIQSKL